MDAVEELDKAMAEFGPSYQSHWDAWKKIVDVDLASLSIREHLDLMETEACTCSMLFSLSPALYEQLQRELDVMKLGLIGRVAKDRPNPRDLIAMIRDARINHWRKFPHPPEMKRLEPEGMNER